MGVLGNNPDSLSRALLLYMARFLKLAMFKKKLIY